jgi:signal transduction histidine kinase
MKRISITEKLILYFVLLGVFVIVIIGSYSYHFSKQALLNRTFDQLISLRIEKKNRVEQFFQDRQRELSLLSKSGEINKVISLLNYHQADEDRWKTIEKNSYLNKYLASYNYCQKIYIIDNQNHVIVFDSISSVDKHHFLLDTLKDPNLIAFNQSLLQSGEIKIADLSKPNMAIYVGTPLYNEGAVAGVVILEIPFDAINKIMFEYPENNGLGKTGETYLVGNDLLMRSNSRFHENAVSNIKVETKAVENAFQNKTGTAIIKDYRDISVLSSYSKVNIDGLNWVILAEIDEKEAMVTIFTIRNSILLISIIIVSLVFLFAFFMSRQITSPIKKLKRASELIGSGNYDIVLPVKSLDEIGVLTETFNHMSEQLKKQKEEIEMERKHRMSSLIDGQEMERQRLSRDLHDGLGQSLLAVKMKLEQISCNDSNKEMNIISDAKSMLKDSIQEIRNVSNDLMPAVLEAFGIREGLNHLCQFSSQNSGMNIMFCCDEIPNDWPKRIQIYLYRIAQEAIHNIAKHAEATEAKIELLYDCSFLYLNISDNGKGFTINHLENKGNGIVNIKQRVELLNGSCEFSSLSGEGASIKIKIPIQHELKN